MSCDPNGKRDQSVNPKQYFITYFTNQKQQLVDQIQTTLTIISTSNEMTSKKTIL